MSDLEIRKWCIDKAIAAGVKGIDLAQTARVIYGFLTGNVLIATHKVESIGDIWIGEIPLSDIAGGEVKENNSAFHHYNQQDSEKTAGELSTLQKSFMRRLCERHDIGEREITPTKVAEIMGCEPHRIYQHVPILDDMGYLRRDKKEGRRHVYLFPLKREDGSDYAPPEKIGGVTKLPPGYSAGYGSGDVGA